MFCDPGKVVHTHLPLLPNSRPTISYRHNLGDKQARLYTVVYTTHLPRVHGCPWSCSCVRLFGRCCLAGSRRSAPPCGPYGTGYGKDFTNACNVLLSTGVLLHCDRCICNRNGGSQSAEYWNSPRSGLSRLGINRSGICVKLLPSFKCCSLSLGARCVLNLSFFARLATNN